MVGAGSSQRLVPIARRSSLPEPAPPPALTLAPASSATSPLALARATDEERNVGAHMDVRDASALPGFPMEAPGVQFVGAVASALLQGEGFPAEELRVEGGCLRVWSPETPLPIPDGVAPDVVVPYNSVAVGTFGQNPHDVDGLRVAVRGQGAEVAQPEEDRRVELRRTWGPASLLAVGGAGAFDEIKPHLLKILQAPYISKLFRYRQGSRRKSAQSTQVRLGVRCALERGPGISYAFFSEVNAGSSGATVLNYEALCSTTRRIRASMAAQWLQRDNDGVLKLRGAGPAEPHIAMGEFPTTAGTGNQALKEIPQFRVDVGDLLAKLAELSRRLCPTAMENAAKVTGPKTFDMPALGAREKDALVREFQAVDPDSAKVLPDGKVWINLSIPFCGNVRGFNGANFNFSPAKVVEIDGEKRLVFDAQTVFAHLTRGSIVGQVHQKPAEVHHAPSDLHVVDIMGAARLSTFEGEAALPMNAGWLGYALGVEWAQGVLVVKPWAKAGASRADRFGERADPQVNWRRLCAAACQPWNAPSLLLEMDKVLAHLGKHGVDAALTAPPPGREFDGALVQAELARCHAAVAEWCATGPPRAASKRPRLQAAPCTASKRPRGGGAPPAAPPPHPPLAPPPPQRAPPAAPAPVRLPANVLTGLATLAGKMKVAQDLELVVRGRCRESWIAFEAPLQGNRARPVVGQFGRGQKYFRHPSSAADPLTTHHRPRVDEWARKTFGEGCSIEATCAAFCVMTVAVLLQDNTVQTKILAALTKPQSGMGSALARCGDPKGRQDFLTRVVKGLNETESAVAAAEGKAAKDKARREGWQQRDEVFTSSCGRAAQIEKLRELFAAKNDVLHRAMTSDSLSPLLQSVNIAYDKRQIRHGIVLREHIYAMREAQRDSEP
eukprot:Transcript_7797.p1 GENE.Transcript_7797~~Transcript_7797.p1  ORF type:complete len:953 (-),score=219.13 Transcript_7797:304-2991(-)